MSGRIVNQLDHILLHQLLDNDPSATASHIFAKQLNKALTHASLTNKIKYVGISTSDTCSHLQVRNATYCSIECDATPNGNRSSRMLGRVRYGRKSYRKQR